MNKLFVFLCVVVLVISIAPPALAIQYSVIDLGILGGDTGYACDFNDSGQVVGYSRSGSLPNNRAFFWENGVMSDLGVLERCNESLAKGINNLGQAVGHSKFPAEAFLWENGVMAGLGTLGGNHSDANSINDTTKVVGSADLANGETRAFIWENNVMSDLGTLEGSSSRAMDINNSGQIAWD